ncbi:MAG: OmpH family outer membrane protein [Bacteroidales bacterium]|nr:OmpH family outer membrane protein [Bacteroidales bacterium]
MKKFSIYASAIMVALLMSTTSCSNNESNTEVSEESVAAGASAVQKDSVGHVTEFAKHVRYVDMQKVQAQYTSWQELVKLQNDYAEKFAAYQNELGASLQKKQTAIEEKRSRNGYLTQESFAQDVADFEKAQNDANNKLAARQEKYALEINKKQEVILDSVYSVINDMSVKYQLDAVLEKSAGLYLNPQLNLTDEVIEELNRRIATPEAAQ